MPVLYANNAASRLAASITNVATSFSVTAGHGARFPAISGGDYFYATLMDSAGNLEVVKVTARATDTFTVTRAQEGTTARAYAVNDIVELRITKAMLDDFKTDTRAGNAATATALQTARTIGGVSFNGTANINLPGVNAAGNQSTTGNAATATALQTARTIGGVSFNGTANINLPGVNAAGNQNTTGSAATLTTARAINGTAFNGSANITTANWGTARTLTIGNTGKSVNGSANVAWSVSEIGAESLHSFGVPRSNLGDPTVREMALFDAQFDNKTERYNIAQIFVETSTDNVTWTAFSVSDTNKRLLVGGDGFGGGVTIPYNTPYFRIRLRATSYVYLNALYMYWSSNGHSSQVQVYKKHDSGSWTQHTSSTTLVSAWPGHLYLPFSTLPWNPTAALGTHWHEIYVVFQPNWSASFPSNGISLNKMQWWGGYPAGKRNLYGTNELGDASFPAALSAVGTVTAPTFSGALSGNATTATTLQTARTINGVSFNGSANITVADSTKLPLAGGTMTGAITFAAGQTWPTFNQNTTGTAAVATAATVTTSTTASAFKVPFANTTASTTGNYGLLQDSEATFTYNPSTNTLVVGTVSGALSGNASTATALQTARTINGVSFNGTANITIPTSDSTKLPLAGGALTGTLSTTAGVNLTRDSASADPYAPLSVTRGTASNFAYASFTRVGQVAWQMGINTSNSLIIGSGTSGIDGTITSVRLTLDTASNLTAAGNITANSDERLKKDWAALPVDFVERLAEVKHGTYTRIDSGERQIGVSAQALQPVAPEGVMGGEYLSVAYGNVALVSAIELAKRLIVAEKEIAVLKEVVRGQG